MTSWRGPVAAVGLAVLSACGPITVVVEQPIRPTPGPSPSEPRPTPTSATSPTPNAARSPIAATPMPSPRVASPSPFVPPPTPRPYPSGKGPVVYPSGQGPASPLPMPSAFISGKTVIISGVVYDDEGARVDGAIVTVKSLDASVPYMATATTAEGSWVVNNMPEGANMEVMATKDGWTRRRRVGSWMRQPDPRTNVVCFGQGAAGPAPTDPAGGPYFIADRPEIEAVEPTAGARGVDPTRMLVKLRLSEPLGQIARGRMADALRVFPVSPNEPLPQEDAAFPLAWDLDGKYPQAVREGTLAAGDMSMRARTTWNAEATEITLDYPVPMARDTTYAVGLAGPLAGPIEDDAGHELGTGAAGTARAGASPGFLLLGAFKDRELALDARLTLPAADARWQATHLNVTTFKTTP